MSNSSKKIFSTSIMEIIRARKSVRTYDNRHLPSTVKEKIMAYANEISGVFGAKVRFTLIDTESFLEHSRVKLGTYGVITGAASYLVVAVNKNDKNMEEVGYMLEQVILYATELGLGTCWLGGTFKREAFVKAIKLKEDELLPVIVPIGYAKEHERGLISLFRFIAGSGKRKPWEKLFFQEQWNTRLSMVDAAAYFLPLEMVRLAPSAMNRQPWRIMIDKNMYHFYLQHTQGMASIGFDIQKIDMGIAMAHFELTARELSLPGYWQVKEQEPQIKNMPAHSEYIVSWVDGQQIN